MRKSKWMALAGICGLLLTAGTASALAELTVEVKGVHLCCGACVKGVGEALKGLDGIKPKCDQDAGTVTLTATDAAAARKALDALGTAGYFGETGNKDLAIKSGSAPKGSVKKVTISGLHNCCRSCNTAIQKAVKSVKGVTGDTAKAKSETFEVTGDFNAGEVIEALNKAGFNASAK